MWEYRKIILGWIFDGIVRSIGLPDKKVKEILQELKTIGRKGNIPLERYQQILGRLRRAAIGIPTGKGLFTPLYIALKSTPKIVYLNQDIVLALRDWRILIKMATKKRYMYFNWYQGNRNLLERVVPTHMV